MIHERMERISVSSERKVRRGGADGWKAERREEGS